jgi:hypothetical protein
MSVAAAIFFMGVDWVFSVLIKLVLGMGR